MKRNGDHRPRLRRVVGVLACVQAVAAAIGAPASTSDGCLSLAGTWRFRLDPDSVGVERKWFAETLDDAITLPGTTDTNQKGVLKDENAIDRLSRVWYWKGPAWYQRDVEIPESWRGRRITLLLERTKTTRVWVDDRDCGGDDTLSGFQIFDLTGALKPGRHVLTVLVDNARLPPVGPAHAVDERTQSNWNGIIGRMELRATGPVWIEDAQVYPDAARQEARVRLVIGNITGQPATGRVEVACESCNVAIPARFAKMSVAAQALARRTAVDFTYRPGDAVPLWDEFQPALLRLDLDLQAAAAGRACGDRRSVRFGLRDFKRDGQRLAINGRTVFLRGRLDCANYPLTGYPPMDREGWRRVLGILKDWGLNHVRFHSWCPPEAAFEAADELGFYLQPELPNKRSAFKSPESTEAAQRNIDYLDVPGANTNASLYEYAVRESDLIFRHFGNHPSFAMFTLGNELGRTPAMHELVARFRERDPRHLYAQGSNNMHWDPSLAEGDDFWVTGKTGKDRPVRGAFFGGDFPGGGHIYSEPPSSRIDYRNSIHDVPVPVIAHETGEFQVTPDFREIPKYTGVLKARNLEIFRQRLKDADMLDLSHDFMRASGALAAICQREDIEAALRTPGFDGFQWLDIMDFPGQGTALVGMLNVFMESKGLTTPEAWRQFCCETVPLLLMPKYAWTTEETFAGEVKVAHYGPADLREARVNWMVGDGGASALASGTLGPVTIRQGGVFPVGQIRAPLNRVDAPKKLNVTISIPGTAYLNRYDLWVYPPEADTRAPDGVCVTRRLDEAALKVLADGGRVLLFPKLDELKLSVAGAFPTDFWCWPMFAKGAIAQGREPAPGTQGFLCDPKHPALAEFPTEFHSNWQWWRIVTNARPIILDGTPSGYRPIIHVIDNFARNHKLGLLFETSVGKGSLLVCASDLPSLQGHPEARQLMRSLLRYVGSDGFRPNGSLDKETLERIL
ncbi:MAG: beta-galactosidase [Lentisphaerae bacterium]|nr:beta-galactosidase [Lentisphaerota bacterium]